MSAFASCFLRAGCRRLRRRRPASAAAANELHRKDLNGWLLRAVVLDPLDEHARGTSAKLTLWRTDRCQFGADERIHLDVVAADDRQIGAEAKSRA
jgi:hypothetical protein